MLKDITKYYLITGKLYWYKGHHKDGVAASFIHMIGFDVKMSTGHRDNKGSNQDIQILMLIVK